MTRDTFLQIGFAGLAVVLCTVPTAADTKTHYEYDAAGQVTRQWVEDTETSAVLSEVRNEYDNLDRVWQTRQLATPNGNPSDNVDRVTEIGFDQAGNTVSVRRKATTGDALTMYDFDWANRCTLRREAQRWVEGEPQYADTTYGYDGRGHVVYVQDPVGNEARFTYDAGGRQSEEKRYEGTALDLRIVSAYDSRDNKIRETAYDSADVALTQKRWEYDSLDRNTRRAQLAYPASTEEIDLATDRVTDLTYDSGSQRLETETAYAGIPPAPRTTTYQYDEIGRLSLTTDPEGNTEQVTGYNVHSQVLTKTISEPPLADRTFTYGYDNLGHRTSETAHGPQEPETDYFYDALDRQTRVTDAKHYSTDTAYNAFGEVRLVTEDATGTTPRETESEYDQLGYLRVERTWAGEGRTQQEETNYAPDLMGRRTHIEFPDSSAWDYVYDAAGRMTHRTDPRTLVTVYERNWRGQVLKKWLGVELKETFDYNPLGWMTFAERDASNRVDFTTRDAFGQVTAETQTVNGTSKTLTHTYNQVGECVTLAYPAGVGVSLTYTHDGLGQVTEIKRNGALLASYTHAGSWLTERAIRTTALLPTWIRHQVTPDVHRRPSPIVNRADLNGQLSDIDRYVHTYDDVGNRLTATITGSSTIADTVGCDYDRLHRLTGAHYATGQTNEGFGYDLLSNRLTYADRDGGTTSYTPNLVNEYTVITPGANAPEHDSGNLTRNEHGYRLAYDYENRLVEVRDAADEVLASYEYDALGRRMEIAQGGVTTLLFHDGGAYGDADRIVAEYEDAGALKRYYVQGPTYADEHVLVHEWADAGSDSDWYYLLSALYTVSGLANPAGRAVVWYTYDAYGRSWTTLADQCLEQPGQYRGDSDCSGDVNFDDIGYFVTALAGGANGEAAWAEYYRNRHNQEDPPCAYLCVNDVDGDGGVNFNDINPFVRCLVDGHQCAIGGPPGSRYAFTGRELDFDLRDPAQPGDPRAASWLTLYHYRARAYDAWHGRFLQRDPAEYAESLNLYQYVLSNPQKLTDPMGLGWGMEEDIDAWIGDYQQQITHAQMKLTYAKWKIKHDVKLAMIYAQLAFMWDEFVWNRDEAILFDLIAGPFFSTICFEAGTPVLMADGSFKGIEEIRLGEWVRSEPDPLAPPRTTSCHPGDPDSYDEIDPAIWRQVELCLHDTERGLIQVALLRPLAWLETVHAAVGAEVPVILPEMGIVGSAEVTAIAPCPPIEAGSPGTRPVTGTFVTERALVIDLYVEGLDQPIGVTPGHPFYSVDRLSWVPAGELSAGESLRTTDGAAHIVGAAGSGHVTVFNIETAQSHTYHVASVGLWVHNPCFNSPGGRQYGTHVNDYLGQRTLFPADIDDVLDNGIKVATQTDGSEIWYLARTGISVVYEAATNFVRSVTFGLHEAH